MPNQKIIAENTTSNESQECLLCGRPRNFAKICPECSLRFAQKEHFDLGQDKFPLHCGTFSNAWFVGEGAHGKVWGAQDDKHGRFVAVKILGLEVTSNAESRREKCWRFDREIRFLSALDHPAIVRVFDSGIAEDGSPWYSMDLVDGGTLHEWLESEPPLITRLRMFESICSAVGHAHRRGIMHRDLKPANILVERVTNAPRIIDFGLAKLTSGQPVGDKLTLDTTTLGTPVFMAPEQAVGAQSASENLVDIYALGALLLYLLSRRPPYDSDGAALETLEKIRTTPPFRLRQVATDAPRDLEAIIDRAMQRDTTQRYPTAEALCDDVGRFLKGQAVRAREGQHWYVFRKFIRKYWQPIAGVAVLSLLVAIGVWEVVSERTAALNEQNRLLNRRAELLLQAQQSFSISLVEADRAARSAGHPEWAEMLASRIAEQPWEWAGEGGSFAKHQFAALQARLRADWLASDLRFSSAVPEWQRAVKSAKEWKMLHPTASEPKRELVLSFIGLAHSLGQIGSDKAAMSVLEEAKGILGKPHAAHEAQSDLWHLTMAAFARLHLSGKRWTEAAACFAQCKTPANAAEEALLRLDLAKAHVHLGNSEQARIGVDAALGSLRSAASAIDPTPDSPRTLAQGLLCAASVHIGLGEAEQSIQCIGEALSTARQLRTAGVPFQQFQFSLMASRVWRAAALALRRTNASAARQEFENILLFLRTQRADVTGGPTDNALRMQIAGTLRLLADTCLMLRDLSSAAQNYRLASSRYDLLARRLSDQAEYGILTLECTSSAHALRQHAPRNDEPPIDYPDRIADHLARLETRTASLTREQTTRLARIKPLTHDQRTLTPDVASTNPEANGIFLSQASPSDE